jgi:carbamoyltransferase
LHKQIRRRPALHVFSVYRFSKTGFTLLFRESAESFNTRCGSSSIGETYAAVSQYIFGSWHDSGKLMGLAAFGDAGRFGRTCLKSGRHDLPGFGHEWKLSFTDTTAPKDIFRFADLAARIQVDFEKALEARVALGRRLFNNRNIVLSGGLALNCVSNAKLAERFRKDKFFVFPASNDAGISIGAAVLGNYKRRGLFKSGKESNWNEFLGIEYSRHDYRYALREYEHVVNWTDLNLADVARRLSNAEVIGWFEGGSEFGPRALGHRSILADPRPVAMWSKINEEIKNRDDFRPLAPVTVSETAHRYFDIVGDASHMMFTARIKRRFRKQLPAVCHRDGTARLQIIDFDTAPTLHSLLCLFGKLTGLPILINTSLNSKGHPLVETPSQAINLMLSVNLNGLRLGDYFVHPTPVENRDLTVDTVLFFGPSVRIFQARSSHNWECRIEKTTLLGSVIYLPADTFSTLSQFATPKSVGSVLRGLGSREADNLFGIVVALWKQRYLLTFES